MHLTKAKKSGTAAAIQLVPIIWSFLNTHVPGLDLESILTMGLEEDFDLIAHLDLFQLLNSYNTLDRDSNLWSTVYKGDTWVIGRKRNKNRNKITTGAFIKALFKHIGIQISMSLNNPSKRKRDDENEQRSWNITISTSIQNLCIISCIFSPIHWGNFHVVSASIGEAMRGDRNSILLYKEDIIQEHFKPKGDGGEEDVLDLDSSTVINSTQISMNMDLEEDLTNSQHFVEFMME